MKKRIITLASVLAVSMSAIPYSASALYTQTNGIELHEGWSFCNDFAVLQGGGYDKITVDSSGQSYRGYKKIDDVIVFKPADGVDISEINAVLAELNENYHASSRSLLSDYSDFKCMIEAEGGISSTDAKNIINAVKDKALIKDAVYLNERYEMKMINVYLNCYSGFKFETADGTEISYADMVMDYLKNNDISDIMIDNSLTENKYNTSKDLYLKFPDSLSRDEKMAVAEKIFNETGAYPDATELTSANNVSAEIKLLDFIDGDANNNGKLELSDAIMVMQAVGNPDEFVLDVQQKFNADISGNGDGVTNMDALEIQQRLLGAF